jgi:hypothetical protein
MTTPTTVSAQGTVLTATTCTSATSNDGHHVDHAIWACDKACHYNRTRNGYTQTVTGSYCYGIGTTFINDAPIGRVTKKRCNKHAVKCGQGQG